MATATLTLNDAKKVTTSNTAGKLREIEIPIGTQTVKISSTAGFYIDTSGAADEGDQNTARQFYYPAGVYYERPWDLGGRAVEATRDVWKIYIIGTSTSQEVFLHAIAAA